MSDTCHSFAEIETRNTDNSTPWEFRQDIRLSGSATATARTLLLCASPSSALVAGQSVSSLGEEADSKLRYKQLIIIVSYINHIRDRSGGQTLLEFLRSNKPRVSNNRNTVHPNNRLHFVLLL